MQEVIAKMALIQVSYFSLCLSRETTFNVLLPIDSPIPGHAAASGEKLRTLYLLHGYSGTYTDWLHYSRIRELADRYRIAVVMPSGENHFYVDDEDKRARYGEFVGRELVQLTRRMFPLSEQREDTWIGGLSMGGFGAIRNGLKYAGHFGKIIALSSAILTYRIANAEPGYTDGVADYNYFTRVFGDLTQVTGSDKDPEALIRRLQQEQAEIPQLYLACGSEDFLLDVNHEFRDFLTKEQIPHVYHETPGGHTWDFWNEYISLSLDWATQASSDSR